MKLRQWGVKDNKGKPRIKVELRCDKCNDISVTSIDNYYQYVKKMAAI